jgi:hypothetical protein
VPSSFKVGIEKYLYHIVSFLLTDKPSGKSQYIGVVMLPHEAGYFYIPAQGASDIPVVIQRHIDAVTCSADGYASVTLTRIDGGTQLMAEIGVIDALCPECTEINVGNTLLFEQADDILFQRITGMVAGQADGFIWFWE